MSKFKEVMIMLVGSIVACALITAILAFALSAINGETFAETFLSTYKTIYVVLCGPVLVTIALIILNINVYNDGQFFMGAALFYGTIAVSRFCDKLPNWVIGFVITALVCHAVNTKLKS